MNFSHAALSAAALALTTVTAFAADYPAPKQGDWIARDFKFHTGETMPELRLHYTTDRRADRTARTGVCTARAARRRAC